MKTHKQDMMYCCESMKNLVQDISAQIKYDNAKRSYYIKRSSASSVNCIDFCPWCGTKLPKDLISEYYDTLEKEFHTSDEDIINKNIPEEFKSGEWWKKRGL